MKSSLSPLQHRLLAALQPLKPEWTLTGGGALCGFHLGHRTTEDLDLFFYGQTTLDHVVRDAHALLASLDGQTQTVQSGPAFHRLTYREPGATDVQVDLVADPVPQIERPITIDGVRVDTPHELLVNKLCALLSRTELRDLEDVRALTAAGGDLGRALRDAPKKDGGFSPATLAFTLQSLPVHQSERLGYDPALLVRFREQLTEQLLGPDALSPADD